MISAQVLDLSLSVKYPNMIRLHASYTRFPKVLQEGGAGGADGGRGAGRKWTEQGGSGARRGEGVRWRAGGGQREQGGSGAGMEGEVDGGLGEQREQGRVR